MTSTDVEQRPSDRFVSRVTERCARDRGQRAALRRGLRRPPEQAHTMHAVVAPLLPAGVSREHEYAYYAVAAMIAGATRDRADTDTASETSGQDVDEVTEETDGPGADGGPPTRANLGASLAWAVCRPGTGRRAMNRAAAEKRLHLLVRQGYPGVYQQLAGVVRYIGAVEVEVNWAQLLEDLCQWRYRRDWVAKRWLQSFYRVLHQADRRAARRDPNLEESA
ncbi:type I-E CRISPR-associated protein Cse2/CasB [Solwaraspora sp. WMMD406]|uniref:type I-E CRISPR-associated protein Cse2/CasB n=1 Tax=Solwaraspora sp. WMMD406 TaxID=3016095 RepID=UPI002415D345|nr:type I-E CRISPR-associated protein Cse2/CasB [Solwaraspora sp. WMMD406]MDG4768627.1 type I-E CRISPR-associated protein Cse2/CasB [Solwaraspora sp. WMMD406]